MVAFHTYIQIVISPSIFIEFVLVLVLKEEFIKKKYKNLVPKNKKNNTYLAVCLNFPSTEEGRFFEYSVRMLQTN